jgi:hypothetical protein
MYSQLIRSTSNYWWSVDTIYNGLVVSRPFFSKPRLPQAMPPLATPFLCWFVSLLICSGRKIALCRLVEGRSSKVLLREPESGAIWSDPFADPAILHVEQPNQVRPWSLVWTIEHVRDPPIHLSWSSTSKSSETAAIIRVINFYCTLITGIKYYSVHKLLSLLIFLSLEGMASWPLLTASLSLISVHSTPQTSELFFYNQSSERWVCDERT